jgi:hypothetical protein
VVLTVVVVILFPADGMVLAAALPAVVVTVEFPEDELPEEELPEDELPEDELPATVVVLAPAGVMIPSTSGPSTITTFVSVGTSVATLPRTVPVGNG